jgi:hypothetical protein
LIKENALQKQFVMQVFFLAFTAFTPTGSVALGTNFNSCTANYHYLVSQKTDALHPFENRQHTLDGSMIPFNFV